MAVLEEIDRDGDASLTIASRGFVMVIVDYDGA